MYSQFEIYSQETYSAKAKKPVWFIGINGGWAINSQITYEGLMLGSGLRSSLLNDYFGSMEIGYFWSKIFGISSGISFTYCKSQLNVDTYNSQYYTTDSENENYLRQVEGKNIKEVQDVVLLSLPLYLNVRMKLGKKFGLFLKGGADLAVPLSKNFTSSGSFTFKGYYSTYNVLLENLPDYGFTSNASTVSKGELELKPYVYGIASAGIDFFILKKLQIGAGVFYNQSFTNISGYTSQDKFHLSSDVNQINSIMGASSNVSVQSSGILITLRYYLK